MTRILTVVPIILFSICGNFSIAMEDAAKGESLRVLWLVSKFIPGPQPQLDEKTANSYLGQPLDMDVNSITFAGSACTDIDIQKSRVDTETFLRKIYKVSPDVINYKDRQILLIETNCTLDGFGQFFQLKDRRLVVLIQGVFFIFEPNVNY